VLKAALAGHMGDQRLPFKSRSLVVDADKHLLAVRGSVPGARGGILLIREARKGSR
jgi:large subunit ribosomal protein L3